MPIKRSTRKVFRAFKRGEARQMSEALWTDGRGIYSGGVAIAAKSGRSVMVSPVSPFFPPALRQRIAEIWQICPKAKSATTTVLYDTLRTGREA